MYHTIYQYASWALYYKIINQQQFCEAKMLTDIAIVNVEIATDTIIRSRNKLKSTFEEKLAYVGKWLSG